MSQPNCDACTELREYAPRFVMDGVTTSVANHLRANEGLSGARNHDNCEDLNDVNDCLIGRLGQEIEALDVCDWKDYMSRFMPNLYETLKAMITGDCGQWDKIIALCSSVDSILDIIRGGSAEHHAMTPTQTFRQKFFANAGDPASTDISQYLFPEFQCEIRSGVGCDASKRMLLYRASVYLSDGRIEPYVANMRVENLAVGDVLGYLPMSAVVPEDAPESWWKRNLRSSGSYWAFSISSIYRVIVALRGYVIIDGVVFNEDLASYGENTMVMIVQAIEENNGTGGITTKQMDTLRTEIL